MCKIKTGKDYKSLLKYVKEGLKLRGILFFINFETQHYKDVNSPRIYL